jgi:hypothetical protein
MKEKINPQMLSILTSLFLDYEDCIRCQGRGKAGKQTVEDLEYLGIKSDADTVSAPVYSTNLKG